MDIVNCILLKVNLPWIPQICILHVHVAGTRSAVCDCVARHSDSSFPSCSYTRIIRETQGIDECILLKYGRTGCMLLVQRELEIIRDHLWSSFIISEDDYAASGEATTRSLGRADTVKVDYAHVH